MESYPCIACDKDVRPRQHGISCEKCDRWQHRTCNTGISVDDYRKAVSGEIDLEFVCNNCVCDNNYTNNIDDSISNHDDDDNNTNDYDDIHSTHDDDNISNHADDDNNTNDYDDIHSTHDDDNNSTDNDNNATHDADNNNATHDDDDIHSTDDDNNDDDANINHDDESFRVNLSIHLHEVIQERSLQDASLGANIPDESMTFDVMTGASQKGSDLLCDSMGYSYTVKVSKFESRNTDIFLPECSSNVEPMHCLNCCPNVQPNSGVEPIHCLNCCPIVLPECSSNLGSRTHALLKLLRTMMNKMTK